MSRGIIGVTVGTPINPKKFKASPEDIQAAVDAYLTENPVDGNDGVQWFYGEYGKGQNNGEDVLFQEFNVSVVPGSKAGDFYLNTHTKRLYQSNGTKFVLVTNIDALYGLKYTNQGLTDNQKKNARANIGAVSQEGVNEAVSLGIAEAKANGEFDGKDGKDGAQWFFGTDFDAEIIYPVTNAKKGDLYVNTNTNNVYQLGDSKWTYRTNIKGAQGIQGVQGEQGATGATGATGDTGATGAKGDRGATWFTGTTLPSSPAQVGGKDGDFFLNTNTCDYYIAPNVTTWGEPVGNLKGADGEQGIQGTSVTVKSVTNNTGDGATNTVTFSDGKTLSVKNGSKGNQGIQGEQGVQGEQGYSVLRITTAPTSYTTAIGGFTPKYKIDLGKVLSESGASEVRAGDTILRNYYTYRVGYVDSSNVYVGAYASIRGTTGANGKDGYTPTKGVDYFDGQNGRDGIDGTDGEDGYTPVKGKDYYTDQEQAEWSQYIASETAKYKQLEPEFANDISECTDQSKMYVLPDGFIYAYMQTMVEDGIAYANLVTNSPDTDGNPYNGQGWKTGVRLSSGGGVSDNPQTGTVTTGFMPWQSLGKIRIKGGTFTVNANEHYYVIFYNGSKAKTHAIDDNSMLGSDGTGGSGAYGVIKRSYDSTTGITTLDFSGFASASQTSEVGAAARDAVYFRMCMPCSNGNDLIITVNEEIKNSEPTVGYAWMSTGRAFVPADYENRIVALERTSSNTVERVDTIEQQVSDILDGTTEIAASAKFDPTAYRLPILYLTGSTTGISKETAVTLSYKCKDKNGTEKTGSCTLKWQGSSSLAWDKKNYTIKFDTAFEVVDGWGAQNKYCLKANWIDHSHSRNVVSAKLWGAVRKNRSNLNSKLASLPNAGAIDGFPCIIVLNGEFHGLYAFNIPKEGWMFGMGSGTKEAIVGADNQANDTAFKAETLLDANGWELEYNVDTFSATDVKNSLNTLIRACINSNGSDLDTTIANYLDWDSAIDYYIFAVIVQGGDMITKNALLATFDGVKWYFSAYDMDTTYGLEYDGSRLNRAVTTTHTTFDKIAEAHRVFELIRTYKAAQLKARYNELRADVLSESRICLAFENYAWDISSPILMEDVKKWSSIRGSSVNGIDQICRWVRQRLEAADEWANAL